jgi:two-component system cell cycle sensor histidine kinase/response regulator CckA
MPHRLTREDLLAIVEGAPFMLAVVDPDGRVAWCNAELARVLGRPAGALVGASFAALGGVEGPDHEAASRLLADGEPLAMRLVRADGAALDAVWRAVRLEGGLVAAIGRDVTEERAQAARLARAQRLEAIGRLTGGIAHDFNNLLTVIQGNAQILVELRELTGDAYDEAAEILRAADTARAVVRQLLTFTGRARQPVGPVDVNGHVENLRGIVQRLLDSRTTVEFELDGGLPPVTLEEGQIEQVVINLLLNAREAMPAGGRIEVQTRLAAIDEPGVELPGGRLAPGRYVAVTVKDSGRGMDAETFRRLFEPFFTTREASGGTGLGLATVHAIVRQARGSVDVVSAPGRGAAFTIYLPAAAAGKAAPEDAAMPPRAPSGSILVVDHHESVRTLCRRALENDSHQVREAASLEAALEAAHEAGPFDLIVADVRLPGENGRELLEHVRAGQGRTRLLLTSGHPRPEGYDGPFLEKPFTPPQLVAAVRRLLCEH